MNQEYKKTVEITNNFDIENHSLKNHILLLTGQNQKLITEIENILAQDCEMSNIISRREYLLSLLQDTKIEIESTLSAYNLH